MVRTSDELVAMMRGVFPASVVAAYANASVSDDKSVDVHLAADVVARVHETPSVGVGGIAECVTDPRDSTTICYIGGALARDWGSGTFTLIGVVDDERAGTSSPTLMRSRRLTLSWEVVNTTRIAAGLTIAMASATLLVPDSIQMQKSVFVSSEALATANGWDAYGSLRSVDADLAIGCDALKPRESELFFQLLVQLLDVHNTDMKKMRETAYLADDGGAMQVQFD